MAKDKAKKKAAAAKSKEKADKVEKKAAEADAEKDDGAEADPEPKPSAKKTEPAKAKHAGDDKAAARAKAADGDHGHGDKHAAGHGHSVNRREYWVIFVVLFVLTVLEVAVAQVPGLAKILMGTALVGLALTKAACVGLFYMHLKHETKVLRWGVAVPFAAPALYAFVLIAEGTWRLARPW